MEIERGIGGFRKPISVREFILSYLRKHGEAYAAEMHRAYKDELERVAERSPRRRRVTRSGEIKTRPYHVPRYHSFQMQVWRLAQEGEIEFARAEPTEGLNGQFSQFAELPERHYFKLKS